MKICNNAKYDEMCNYVKRDEVENLIKCYKRQYITIFESK